MSERDNLFDRIIIVTAQRDAAILILGRLAYPGKSRCSPGAFERAARVYFDTYPGLRLPHDH